MNERTDATPTLPTLGRRPLIAGLGGALIAAVVAPHAVPASAAVTDRHVVVIGCDGLLFSRIAAADAPNLDALIGSGYSSLSWLYADPMAPTFSGPGWATILSGVWPDKHRVLSNSWGTSNGIIQYPDFLTRLERANSSLSTYAASTWGPILDGSVGTPLVGTGVDSRYVSTGDADTTAAVVGRIGSGSAPHAIFLQLDDIDHAGHDHGAASQEYLDAISVLDGQVGQIRRAVAARPSTEQWYLIVTADHGHTDAGGHGGATPAERASFIIKTGPGIARSTPAVKPKVVDIAADVLTTFGVAVPTALDGRPLSASSSDPFDTVIGSLQARVDETAIPATVVGWTHTTPSGWSIDNSAMGSGGVTEWRGWSFTTDEFWTRTDPGQGRETNVRARGVFAVADSDEWSDRTRTGLFSSRLVSPAFTVTAGGRATIGYTSHYRKEGGETARLQVSFDDGSTWSTVSTLTGDRVAVRESVAVTVPAGRSRMRVAWSLTDGDNNWFWAIDDPRVS